MTTVCKLLTAEMIPAVLPQLEKCLEHQQVRRRHCGRCGCTTADASAIATAQGLVRKKAVAALYRCYLRDPGSVAHMWDAIRRMVCDKDPSVMASTLPMYLDACRANPDPFKTYVPTFTSVLKQILEHRLSQDNDYYGISAPWMQIKLLKIMAVLGADDQKARSVLARMHDTGTAAATLPLPCPLLMRMAPCVRLAARPCTKCCRIACSKWRLARTPCTLLSMSASIR